MAESFSAMFLVMSYIVFLKSFKFRYITSLSNIRYARKIYFSFNNCIRGLALQHHQ